ncbi:DUF1761 domain-containing protein [Candidatus Jorgensenbacteria bacterium]|nr:DUF1761 domain-containing protein [Candidatus Jorgensenbacteria bacterium]
MFDFTFSINCLAVLVAAIVNFVIGAAWHGPLFGKHWMRLAGITHENMKAMKMTPKKAMTLGFVSVLVMTYVLAYFINALNITDVVGVFMFTFLVWLGFFATTLANSVLWEGKSAKLYLFNIAYQFVSLLITISILAFW